MRGTEVIGLAWAVRISQYGALIVYELVSANCLFKTLEDVLKINQVIKL